MASKIQNDSWDAFLTTPTNSASFDSPVLKQTTELNLADIALSSVTSLHSDRVQHAQSKTSLCLKESFPFITDDATLASLKSAARPISTPIKERLRLISTSSESDLSSTSSRYSGSFIASDSEGSLTDTTETDVESLIAETDFEDEDEDEDEDAEEEQAALTASKSTIAARLRTQPRKLAFKNADKVLPSPLVDDPIVILDSEDEIMKSPLQTPVEQQPAPRKTLKRKLFEVLQDLSDLEDDYESSKSFLHQKRRFPNKFHTFTATQHAIFCTHCGITADAFALTKSLCKAASI